MVLSNYKCMHIRIQNSEISIQGLQSYSSTVSSNRIKIQVILLILQLETDYFSSYSFQKCSIRSSGTTVFTETFRTAILHEEVLQDSSAPILQGYPSIHIQPTHAQSHYSTSREFSIQNPILHAEDKELFEYYYYIQRAKRPSFQKRNSTHRRQGDLLEMHPCVLHDLPRTFQSVMTFQPFQAILQFYKVPVSPGNPTHYSILRLECIFYKFYSSIGFHRNLHRVPIGQLQTTNIHSSKKGRCCDIGQIDIFSRIELFPSNVLSSEKTNCKNDIQ